MKHKRKRFQNGSITRRKRKTGPAIWEFCYTDHSQSGARKSLYFSTLEFPTRREVLLAVRPMLARINSADSYRMQTRPTVAGLIERFIAEERLEEVASQDVGIAISSTVKYSTALSYLSNLKNYILPKWGLFAVSEMKPAEVADWFRDLRSVAGRCGHNELLSPKTKGHIKSLMHRLFEKAMLWGLLDLQRNPMELIEIRGVSKRARTEDSDDRSVFAARRAAAAAASDDGDDCHLPGTAGQRSARLEVDRLQLR